MGRRRNIPARLEDLSGQKAVARPVRGSIGRKWPRKDMILRSRRLDVKNPRRKEEVRGAFMRNPTAWWEQKRARTEEPGFQLGSCDPGDRRGRCQGTPLSALGRVFSNP